MTCTRIENLSESLREELYFMICEKLVIKEKRLPKPKMSDPKVKDPIIDLDGMTKAAAKHLLINPAKGVAKKLAEKGVDKINKSKVVKNTIGADSFKKAKQNHLQNTVNYEVAKRREVEANRTGDSYAASICRAEKNRYKKDMNKTAKEVDRVKNKYGFTDRETLE